MHALRTLHTLLADPRRRLGAALMIVVLILGIVTMHAMSGSSTAHAGQSSMEGLAQVADTSPAGGPVAGAIDHASDGPQSCDHGCGEHDLMTAMCLMVLAVLLILTVPVRRVVFVVGRVRAGPRGAVRTPPLLVRAPSLHVLSISRT
ncbi:DUF6153 family protein [Isoptericola sp. NPDC057391]|uniref:DUF6153 family protein n=1 Tax=Isoptericola sp. NPDC057391 TaxID=3346117 RepID=UPI00362A4BCA